MFPARTRILSRFTPVALAATLVWSCSDAPDSSPPTGPDPADLTASFDAVGLSVARSAQARHGAALHALDGVIGHGIGATADGGHEIRVFLSRPDVANVPAHVNGVRVVPVVTGMIRAGDANDPQTKERPAPNGFSIGHPAITAGTMGAIVEKAGNFFILSNNHVLANSNDASIGDPALQPGPADGGNLGDQIGTLTEFEVIDFSGASNAIDAAIASVNGGDVTGLTPAPGVGYGAPGTSTVVAELDMSVQKFGRTTNLTSGTVQEIDVTVNVCYEGFIICTKLARFDGQFTVSDGSFSAGGDSGSLIVTNDAGKNPVGLLFAGSSTRTIANPIDAALEAFGVTITTDPGGDPGGNTPPTAQFTFDCTDLTCDFNGSGSSDPDGTITDYDWDFGDGSPNGSGVTTSHTYAGAGTRTVVLTVTDNEGATGSDSQNVTVTEPPGGGIDLSATWRKVKGIHTVDLTWSGAVGVNVDIVRDGQVVATTPNDGAHTDTAGRGKATYVYQVCEEGTSTCSNTVTVTF